MGSGSFDTTAYRSYTNSVASKSRDEIYEQRKIHADLDPRGVLLRESRDSADNPRSTPIIVALDVTGSMGVIAEQIARGGLGTLFEGVLARKPVSNPHLMFMGIGDIECDRAPLQVSQFEADNRIVAQLTKLWLEAGGGGNNHESYDLAWYFAARHTAHDSMAKRGKRGYLFTVGDEETPEALTGAKLQQFLGGSQREGVTSRAILTEAQRLYDVFHVVIEEGDYARSAPDRVKKSWNAMLGQHVIHLADHRLLAETVVSAIQVAEGADHTLAASGWGSGPATRNIINSAISSLPRGVPAPRQLGV